MRQLKLFAAQQAKCWNCGDKFVPYSKESIRLWSDEAPDWLCLPSDVNWAADRTYQENLRFCCTACMYDHYAKEELSGIRRETHKILGIRK